MSAHLPIWFHGNIPLSEIADALASKGIHLRTELSGRMVADSVPAFLRKDGAAVETETVVLLSRSAQRRKA